MLRIKYQDENVNIEHYFPRGIDCSLIGFRNIRSMYIYRICKQSGKRVDITSKLLLFQRIFRLRRKFIKKCIRRIRLRQLQFVDMKRMYQVEVIEAASLGGLS